jgi:uncharacterized membrane protein HdeD (DUF308 family)
MSQSGPFIPGVPGPLQRLARDAWQAVLLIGISAVLLGAIALSWPGKTLVVLGVLFGIFLLISGILQIAAAFGTHAEASSRVLAFISGALSIVLGVFCFRSAFESILLLAVWIGVAWLFRGIAQTAAAASDVLMPARGWQLFAGVLGTLAGLVVIASPFSSIAVLTIFAGVWLIVTGIAEIVSSLRIRSHTRHIPEGL